jgi:hypothetical protein
VTPPPTGPPLLRVFPDHHADPVWDDGGMVDLDHLPISGGLRDDLRSWARQWEDLLGVRDQRYAVVDDAAHAAWRRRGRALALWLQAELGDGHRVEYRDWDAPTTG